MVSKIFYGIDPGLVHTGIVKLSFQMGRREVFVSSTAVAGLDVKYIAELVAGSREACVIEAYRPRSHFSSDQAMVSGVQDLKKEIIGSIVLQNTGVKKVVLQPVMDLFGARSFMATNHQDIQSALRILLLGMYKDSRHNELIYDVVNSHFAGLQQWKINVT